MIESKIIVPSGNTQEEIKERSRIIFDFFKEWEEKNPSKCIYNRNLKSEIHVRNISVIETARHASKRYLSTLAVLQLDSVLSTAKKIHVEKPESRNNQKSFRSMIVMEAILPGISRVKLTVGVRHKTLLKVQYCITAIETEKAPD